MSKFKLLVLFMILFGPSLGQGATIIINTADLTVNSDSDGLCNLKEAIDAANANMASGTVNGECAAGESHPIVDVIEFDVAMLPAFIATFESYTITDSLHFKGPSNQLVTIGGIAFNRVFKIFNLSNDAEFIFTDVTFSDSTIRLPDDYGGAIWAQHFNGASLTFERVHFLRNDAERGGGALGLFTGFDNTTTIKDCYFADNFVNANNTTGAGGGAIFIGGNQNVIIENTTFESNSVFNLPGNNPLDDAAGGAILVRANGAGFNSTIEIVQSTFSDNIAYGVGGAMAMGGPGYPNEISEVTIRHSTFVGNQADFNADQTGPDRGGGAISNGSSNGTNLFNNLIAGNTDLAQNAGPDVAGGFISFGYNLIGNNLNASGTFPAGQPNINDDFVGEPPITILPLVEPMADNGGPTPTRMLLPNSVAVDQGKCNVLTVDQRGHQDDNTGLRTIDQPGISNFVSGCDIGAVEMGAINENPLPSVVDDHYSLLEGEMLVVTEPNGLLANDQDNNALVITSAGGFDSSAGDNQGMVDLLANGAFSFQTNDLDAFGTTTFDYTVSDLYNHADGLVTLTVTPVNDAPFYNASQTQLSAPTGQFLTYPAWATDISPGPANETNQSLVFAADIVSAPAGFFDGFPSIDNQTGDLSFELSLNAMGVATVDITLLDDGGTDNGGVNSHTTTLQIQASDVIFATGFE